MTGKVSWTPETQSLWSGLTSEDSTTHLTNLPHTLPQIRDPWCPAEEAVQEESLGFRTRHQVGILRAAGDPAFSSHRCQLQLGGVIPTT